MMTEDGHRLVVEQIPHLRRYAIALMRNRDSADDLVQDCLERAWSRLHLWRHGSNMRTWLFTIMHNLHANMRRKAHRHPHPLPLEDAGAMSSTPATQEIRLEIRSLADALELLPDDQRAVVLLIGLQEMSYQDAASILDVPVGTVMSRLHRGRERLRQAMSGTTAPALRRIK